MEKYSIQIKRSAVKEIERLPKRDLCVVMQAIGRLAHNPRPMGSKKLCDDEKYRVRCGRYRILYVINDECLIVVVVKVGHRKDVYHG